MFKCLSIQKMLTSLLNKEQYSLFCLLCHSSHGHQASYLEKLSHSTQLLNVLSVTNARADSTHIYPTSVEAMGQEVKAARFKIGRLHSILPSMITELEATDPRSESFWKSQNLGRPMTGRASCVLTGGPVGGSFGLSSALRHADIAVL